MQKAVSRNTHKIRPGQAMLPSRESRVTVLYVLPKQSVNCQRFFPLAFLPTLKYHWLGFALAGSTHGLFSRPVLVK